MAVIVGFIGVLVILRPDLEGARQGYFGFLTFRKLFHVVKYAKLPCLAA